MRLRRPLVSTVLVTGASGFVGSQAVAALRRRGAVVREATGTEDLLDHTVRRRLVEEAGATHLLHLAWTTAHGRFWSDPDNLAWSSASLDLAQRFAAAGGTRVVFGGSCAEYDWSVADGPLDERTSPQVPATLYGTAKLATRSLLEAWGAVAGVSVASGLLFFLYGPREQSGRLVPSVITSLLAGRRVAATDGSQVRDFLHVEDAGEALAALVLCEVTGPVNVASGVGARVAEVVSTLGELFGRRDLLDLGALTRPANDPPRLVASTTVLDERVGRPAPRSLHDGLSETVAWWRERAG